MRPPLRLRGFWAVYRRAELRPVMQQPADRVRAASDLRRRISGARWTNPITGRTDPAVEVSTATAKAGDGADLPLRIYRPRDASTGEALPVVINFHGGGWVSGDARQSEWWASTLAGRAGVAVVSVEYRLAPEHPFPTPVEDCYSATAWVAEHADELRVDASRLAVMGDSAGGNAAAVVSQLARDRGGPTVALQILLYPAVDLRADTATRFASETENADRPILTTRDIENVRRLYLGDGTGEAEDPRASPIVGDLTGLPPALVQTAQFDPLRDHGIAYAAALREAGVEVRHSTYVDAAHGYISVPGVMPGARQALAEAAEVVADHLGSARAVVARP